MLDLPRSKFLYRAVAVGGTFDILHKGHERLLTKAFELGKFVFVGVSGDDLVTTLHKNHVVTSYAIRSRRVRGYLRSQGWLSRARIVKLKDPFGPATRRKQLQALIVSEETRSNGLQANSIRKARGLKPLRLVILKMVTAEDGKPISVTRIRRGELDSEGNLLRAER